MLVAALAIFVATLLATSEPEWAGSDWQLPMSLVPAAVFGLAIAWVIFRLHALDVRLFLRQSAQYALARSALAALFTLPVLLLTFRLGRMSAGAAPGGLGGLLPYVGWVLVVAMLGRYRTRLLASLDRRYFRDAYALQQSLASLGQRIDGVMETGAILREVAGSLNEALHPEKLWLAPAPEYAEGAEVVLPLRHGEQSFGTVALGKKCSGLPYTPEDRRLLEAMASQTAIALDNARLHEALFAGQRRVMELRSQALVDGAEDERRRLAADLHDHVLPDLRHVAGEAERLRGQARGLDPSLAAALAQLEADARAAMDSVREVMEALRPSVLDVLGFGDALESALRKSALRAAPPLSASFRRTGPEPQLAPAESLALFRICQEAINNVVSHAGASSLTVEMTTTRDALYLRLADDGRGPPLEHSGSGRGLANMRYRAELIGATVEWLPNPPRGTAVEVCFPFTGNRADGVME